MTHTADHDAPQLTGVAQTALWTAEMRARESARPAPLFDDPWAALLVTAGGGPPELDADALMSRLLPDWLAVRTRLFDDYLLSAAHGGCRQVVILGAGLDTRALRLEWPEGTIVYEVDLPALQEFKEKALADTPQTPHKASARRVPVPADLNAPWDSALTDAGLDPGQPTAWLCEGMLFCFEEPLIEELVATITRLSAPGSTVGADCLNADCGQPESVRGWLAAVAANGTPWRWQLSDAERWWADRGWNARPADLPSLPYAVERLAPYQQLRENTQGDPMLLITGTRRTGTATR